MTQFLSPGITWYLSDTHCLTSEGWKVELAQQREEIWRPDIMISKENQILLICMLAQRFTHYATAA